MTRPVNNSSASAVKTIVAIGVEITKFLSLEEFIEHIGGTKKFLWTISSS